MIVVTTPTGQVGRQVLDSILEGGVVTEAFVSPEGRARQRVL